MNADQIGVNSSKIPSGRRAVVIRVVRVVAAVGALMVLLGLAVSSWAPSEDRAAWLCFSLPVVAAAAYLVRAAIRLPRYALSIVLSAGIVICLVLYLALYTGLAVSLGDVIFGT